MPISKSDEQLMLKLVTLAGEFYALQMSLHQKREGCACDTTGTCAYHATTFNKLLDIEKTLRAEANRLDKGER